MEIPHSDTTDLKVSEHDQVILQSHTADQPTAL